MSHMHIHFKIYGETLSYLHSFKTNVQRGLKIMTYLVHPKVKIFPNRISVVLWNKLYPDKITWYVSFLIISSCLQNKALLCDYVWIVSHPMKKKMIKWTASSEFGTYRLCEQRRFRRACASAQSRQNLRCSLIQAVSQEEPSDRKPDPWPRWIAGHAS